MTDEGGRAVHQERIWDYYQTTGVHSFAQSDERFRFIVRHVLPRTRVLNIGVGNGNLEALILQKGAQAWSLDPSEAAIRRIQEIHALGDRAHVGYSQSIPFASESFDTVVMTEVLEHLEQDVLAATLIEVSRVLVPGGRFIGTVPADEVLADNLSVCPDCGKTFHRWGHVQSFSQERLIRELALQFSSVNVSRRYFASFESLNWKGRIGWLSKRLALALGVRGSSENFFFVARHDDRRVMPVD